MKVITMAAPHKNYELKKSQPYAEFTLILLNNSKCIKRRNFFHFKYLFSHHFAIPCTPLPGAAATLAPLPPATPRAVKIANIISAQ
jgi:hypothetical protein